MSVATDSTSDYGRLLFSFAQVRRYCSEPEPQAKKLVIARGTFSPSPPGAIPVEHEAVRANRKDFPRGGSMAASNELRQLVETTVDRIIIPGWRKVRWAT